MPARFEDRAWLARVSAANGSVKGAAWAIDEEHLVTCAHVVQDAGSGPGVCVQVNFPLLGTGGDALVLEEGWTPGTSDGMAGDLALLRLCDPPARLEALPVRSLRSLDRVDFSTIGFPRGYESGLNTGGVLGKGVGLERVQLEVTSALLIEPGFSGAAVWSDRLSTVVGMLTSRHRETRGRVAFAIPMRAIADYSPIVSTALQTPLDLDCDRASHWGPRSRGVRSDRDDAGWQFSGRAEALSELAAWLADRRPPALRVLTGTPGSGKSAVLARLVTSADPHYRRRIPDLRPDDPTIPPQGVFDITFHARGRTVREFVEHVASLAEVTADDASTLLSALDENGGPLVIAVDAVDEATEPDKFCWLLDDLANAGNRVLVGCRPHLVDRLGDPEPMRLDEPPYLDRRDVELYVTRLLSSLPADDRPGTEDALVDELAAAAEGNFLVAQLTVQAVASSGHIDRPLPRGVSQAFLRLLAAIPDSDRARDLLLPLALSFGDGLPTDLWLYGAEALRRHYDPADIDELLSSPAASFLLTDPEAAEGRNYRLFHRALIETLTRGRDVALDHRRLMGSWTSVLAKRADGQPSWVDAPPYLCLHAAEHAAAGGILDSLVQDAGYLVAADPDRLLLALRGVSDAPARVARAVYRRAFDTLRGRSADERSGYLGMAARKTQANELADELSQLCKPTCGWAVRWACWVQEAEHFIVGHHDGSVNAVAFGTLASRPVALSASEDGSIRVWDLTTVVQRGEALMGHVDGVTAVAFGQLEGSPIAVSGGRDATVRVWDLTAGGQRGEPLTGHEDAVWSVAIGELDGQPIALSGSLDGTVRVWNLSAGTQRRRPLSGRDNAVWSVALGTLRGKPIALSGGEDETLRIWDLAAGAQCGEALTGHRGRVGAVAFGELNSQPIALSGGGTDGTLRLWDLGRAERCGEAMTGDAGWVDGVAFGKLEGTPIALTCGTGNIRLWDLNSRSQIGAPLQGHDDIVTSVALGELDGLPVALSGSLDRTLRVWDLTAITDKRDSMQDFYGGVEALAVGRVNERPIAICGSYSGVRVWDCITGTPHEPLTREEGSSDAVAFGMLDGCPVGLSGERDGTVRVWDLHTNSQRGEPLTGQQGSVRAVALGNLHGRPIALSGGEDWRVRMWDLAAGAHPGEPLTFHEGFVRALAFGQIDGRSIVVSGGDDGKVRIWDLMAGVDYGEPLTGHYGSVMALALGDLDGRPIGLSGGGDGTVRVWDLAAGAQLGEPLMRHDGLVLAVACGNVDGRLIALCGRDDGTVGLSYLNGQEIGIVSVGSTIRALAFVAPCSALVGADAGLMLIEFSGLQTVR